MAKELENKIAPGPGQNGKGKCRACGAELTRRGRRYCSKECRQHIYWVLALSKGLLKTFNARYAAFSFTADHVILDVLPAWSNGISRFISERSPEKKPAEDLKSLILESGEKWYRLLNDNNSKSSASLCLLKERHNEALDPESIKPTRKKFVRLSRLEKEYLKVLRLKRDELSPDCQIQKIRSAYKKMAKVYHPDVGGDEEKFKRLNEAHKQMILWAENPQYISRKALRDCWSYDGSTNRWSPPL